MVEDGYSINSSTIRGDDAKSTNGPNSVMDAGPEEHLSSPEPLPPKNLKRYATKQRRKRHVEWWLLFFVLAIAATILTACGVGPGESLYQEGCIDKNNSETEQLFRINVPLIKDLSFTRAKFIDLLWDTAIGQGGRFLHGLILHQLVSMAVTLMLERSALPYSFFLGVKFSTVSIESLWACFQTLYSTTPISTTFMVLGLFFTIAHVLSFATIWSATTGYEAATVPAYDILNTGAFILKDSNRLTTCWSVRDLDRVESRSSNPIMGPTFSQAYGTWNNIGDQKEFKRLKLRTKNPKVETSEAFMNVYAYAIAKETFFHRYNTTWNLADLGQISGTDTWYDDNCYSNGIETANGYNFAEKCIRGELYTSVNGWQYAGIGQKEIEKLPSDTRDEENPEDGARVKPSDSDYVPYNTTFLLDTKLRIKERMVPYNSTLWWNSTRIQLDAPFLDIGADCRWSWGSLGLCLCLDGKVLSKDFRTSPQICLNDTGYRWGFSGFVLLIGLALEATWLLVCAVMWFVILKKSELVKMHRPGTGVIRSILDIAGAINMSLGPDTGAYREDELKKVLGKSPPVGFDVDDRNRSGYELIRLRPMRDGTRIRMKLGVNGRTLYG